jgi:hypothetical protein
MIELSEIISKVTLRKRPGYDITQLDGKKRVIIEGVYSDIYLTEGKEYEVVCPSGEAYSGTIISVNGVRNNSGWEYRIIMMEFNKTFQADPIISREAVCKVLNTSEVLSPIIFEPCNNTGAIDITIYKGQYIEDCTICLSNDFYEKIERIIENEFGLIGISYNNTRSCFWHRLIQDKPS